VNVRALEGSCPSLAHMKDFRKQNNPQNEKGHKTVVPRGGKRGGWPFGGIIGLKMRVQETVILSNGIKWEKGGGGLG